MVISDTSCMIDGLPLLYWLWNLGKSGQSMCVMTSRHSCGEDWIVSEAFKGKTVINIVTSR